MASPTPNDHAQPTVSPLKGERESGGTIAVAASDDVQRTFGFWMIIIGLGVTLLLSALENSVLITAAPAVLADIPLGDSWTWITNAFFLCSAACQPLLGQIFDLFGRRWVTLGIVAVFILGSGICGGATTPGMLIAGRAVQGVGSGGIIMAFDVIVSDLVPLRYRGNYIAIVMLIYCVGTTLGPFIGGAISEAGNWRWVFWINLPVGGASLAILFFFLHVNYNREVGWAEKLRRIDYLGNGVLIAGSTAILYALAYAGIRHPWSSWQTLVPLLLGFAAFGLFAVIEAGPWAPREPVMPPRLFGNRTSAIIAANTFLNSALVYWGVFFLPVFFQSVQLASPSRAGVCLIPLSVFGIPASAVGALVLARMGKYKMIHLFGFAVFTVGTGLYTLLDEDTPIWQWVLFQLLTGVGGGVLLNTLLPAFQAPLAEPDQAAATAAWNFVRTLGSVWGVAIPAAVFANYVDGAVGSGGAVTDPTAASLLTGGGAYEHASAAFVEQFPPEVQEQIRAVYREAIKRVFLVSFAFLGLAFLLALFETDVPLRSVLETEYGMKEKARGQKKTDLESSEGHLGKDI